MNKIISCIDYGVYGVDPEKCPCCPECDQPIWLGERITLQTVEAVGHGDLVRLIHTDCSEWGDEDEDEAAS